jgi:hypothetical protein
MAEAHLFLGNCFLLKQIKVDAFESILSYTSFILLS